jgi:hypothetical protein
VRRPHGGPRGSQSGEAFRPRLDRFLASPEGKQRIDSVRHAAPKPWEQSLDVGWRVFFRLYFADVWHAGPQPTEQELQQLVHDALAGRLWGWLYPGPHPLAASALPGLSDFLRPATAIVSTLVPTPAPVSPKSNVVPFPGRAEGGSGREHPRNATAEEIDDFINTAYRERPADHLNLTRPFRRSRFPAFRDALEARGVHVTLRMVEDRYIRFHKDKRGSPGRSNRRG